MSALQSYAPLLPEIILVLGALALLIYGVFRPDNDHEALGVGWLALLVMLAAALAVWVKDPYVDLMYRWAPYIQATAKIGTAPLKKLWSRDNIFTKNAPSS